MKRSERYALAALKILVTILAILGGGFAYWFHNMYPYGRTHHCSKQLGTALRMYAGDHEGKFPAGESSPEASLSLLYPKYMSLPAAVIFCGKTLPEAPTVQRLKNGQLLTPETCGWHYVEGLSEDADPRRAVLWDKVGLGHNGERLPDGGHEVVFADGGAKTLSGAEWRALLADEEKLRASKSK